ncbi:MAG: alpha/beta fold hydrolase [Polaromonas sp.]|uniref:alpha/beta fold hydrolase n=1 Tax=Polaromonas sp. TaxID=1869339 RepID=UPI0017953AB5|nr:alpha/beta fold hydrolase [Polaromonas sp.]MBA3594913.1 alpha/beta fold hydrolase [Polaromonas sp.]
MIQTRLLNLPHGITLSCRLAGDPARPVLMFLHGFPEAAFVWDGLLEHFARPENGGYHCVAPNLRGFEQSSAPVDAAAYRAKHLVQDIAALVPQVAPGGQLEALVAHDWGGAVAWNVAATMPQLIKKLVIINSPHPGTFLRELQHSPAQQACSAYMNFLIRPDAEALLAEDDFRRLWQFLTNGKDPQAKGAPAWLTDEVKDQYRAVWRAGLVGGCNLYRASPLRPPRPEDPAAAAVTLPPELLTVVLPTLVLWAMDDIALPPALIAGLQAWVPKLQLQEIPGASHWIVHEQPALVASALQEFFSQG